MDFQKVFQYSKNLTILYVEDDEQLRSETYDVLEDFFEVVDISTNGKEALEKYLHYYEKKSQYYDLVITDINMPIMDGISLIKEIHKISEDQSIIVVSAYNESSRLIDLIHEGITNFVMKPIAPIQLMTMLHKTSKHICSQKQLQQYRLELENCNIDLDAKVQEQAKEIRFTQQLSIETIANMVESYDDETGTHVKRIEGYTQLLLDKIPLSDECPIELRESVAFASILHDIGKLMIPKNILTKPASLNYEEFETIKTHAKLGGEVLQKANISFSKQFNKDSFLKVASDIAMYHHEKWDGSGYPEGLKGSKIPKCARIVSIADVYDALRSKRVYKEGFTHTKSIEIIKNESGKSFDPSLVKIFLELEAQFDEIYNRLS